MKIVAASVETVLIPIAAKRNGVAYDLTNGSARAVSVAITPQGSLPPNTFPIAATWEVLDPPYGDNKYWISFVAPGNLVQGTKYIVRAQLGSFGGDAPILEAEQVLEAI